MKGTAKNSKSCEVLFISQEVTTHASCLENKRAIDSNHPNERLLVFDLVEEIEAVVTQMGRVSCRASGLTNIGLCKSRRTKSRAKRSHSSGRNALNSCLDVWNPQGLEYEKILADEKLLSYLRNNWAKK